MKILFLKGGREKKKKGEGWDSISNKKNLLIEEKVNESFKIN